MQEIPEVLPDSSRRSTREGAGKSSRTIDKARTIPKWVWLIPIPIVMIFLCCGGGLIISTVNKQQAEEELNQANALWDKGDHTKAVAKYEKVINEYHTYLDDRSDAPIIYGRVIEYEVNHSNELSAKTLIVAAIERKIKPSLNDKKASMILAQVQQEKELKEKRKRESSQPSAITISAAKLISDYHANEIAADQQYKGKRLEVRGIVVSIDKIFSIPMVKINRDGEMFDSSAVCKFDRKSESQLGKLSRGQVVTIRGKCDGLSLTDVFLSNCELVGD